MPAPNQHPEQLARDRIDASLREARWRVQHISDVDLHAARGVAVREYPTDTGPADYILFLDGHPAGVIEAKKAAEGHRLSVVEEQTVRYGEAKLRHLGKRAMP